MYQLSYDIFFSRYNILRKPQVTALTWLIRRFLTDNLWLGLCIVTYYPINYDWYPDYDFKNLTIIDLNNLKLNRIDNFTIVYFVHMKKGVQKKRENRSSLSRCPLLLKKLFSAKGWCHRNLICVWRRQSSCCRNICAGKEKVRR